MKHVSTSLRSLGKVQKLGLLLVTVVAPWLSQRLPGLLRHAESEGALARADGRPFRRLFLKTVQWYMSNVASRLNAIYAAAVALNFLAFLRWGLFPDLRDRLLGVRYIHVDPRARRQVAFEYMNRVMIWNGLSDFLMTMMPLVDLGRLRQLITRRLLPQAFERSAASSDRACGLCGASPMVMPMRAGCQHVFCYYCIASEMMENSGHTNCPRCGGAVENIRHAA